MRAGAGGMTRGGIILIDITAPSLSNASDGTPTADGADDPSVDTNEGNGTLYWAVLTDGGSCTDAQLKAGSGGNIVAGKAGNQVVSGTGTQTTPDITGLSASTNYEIVFLHRDASGNDSSQASVGLTTAAGGGTAPTLVQDDVNEAAGNTNTITLAFGSNVTAGNLVVVKLSMFVSSDFGSITAGMVTKSAGTSTIGTMQLDAYTTRNTGKDKIAILSVPVTGTGSLTIQFATGAGDNCFPVLVLEEWTTADVSGTRVNASATSAATTGTAGASGNVATGGAGMIAGVLAPASPYGTITITEDGAFTLVDEQENDAQYNYTAIWRSVATDTTDSADATFGTSCDWLAAAVAYKSSDPS